MGMFMWWCRVSVYVVEGVVWACLCGGWCIVGVFMCSVGVFMWWVVYVVGVYVVSGVVWACLCGGWCSVGVFMWWVV